MTDYESRADWMDAIIDCTEPECTKLAYPVVRRGPNLWGVQCPNGHNGESNLDDQHGPTRQRELL